jgi:hypothetical protein
MIRHTNRKGDVYYLHVGQTKTGKPKYHFSRKSEGTLAEAIPEGYEIFEKPDTAQVYLRTIPKTAITAVDRGYVESECRKLAKTPAVLVAIEDDALVVYHAESTSSWALERLGGSMFAGAAGGSEFALRHSHFVKLLRFRLTDKDRRLFSVDRWCFRGAIDAWIRVESGLLLDQAVARYAPHIGQESFFEILPG